MRLGEFVNEQVDRNAMNDKAAVSRLPQSGNEFLMRSAASLSLLNRLIYGIEIGILN